MAKPGLRASVKPLSHMGLDAGIPVVMLMSYRGELGETNWWAIPHGITMEPILTALRIPYRAVHEGSRSGTPSPTSIASPTAPRFMVPRSSGTALHRISPVLPAIPSRLTDPLARPRHGEA